MRAIRVHEYGGAEALKLEDVPLGPPGPGEARVRLAYAGVNFIDVYQRTGQYKSAVPFVPGNEGSGVVEAVGEGVDEVRPGDRVAFAMFRGTYAEAANVLASKLVPVPEGVDLATAAAVMLQGMTAHYLAHSTFAIQAGQAVLVHAAAGGVGLLLVQLAKKRGAQVIGTVSTEQKAHMAREAGADVVIRYTTESFIEQTRRATDGRGVHVVYDSVGRTTFEGSLECLRPRGCLVLYGQSSGAVAPFDPQLLNTHGSLFLTRPSLAHYVADREELLWRARDLFGLIRAGELRLHIDRIFPLEAAASAHQTLESRESMGKLLLNCQRPQ